MMDSVSNQEANLPFTGFQKKYGENTFSLINTDIHSFISLIKMWKRALSKSAPACVMSFCDVFRMRCALCYHFRYNFSCIDNFGSVFSTYVEKWIRNFFFLFFTKFDPQDVILWRWMLCTLCRKNASSTFKKDCTSFFHNRKLMRLCLTLQKYLFLNVHLYVINYIYLYKEYTRFLSCHSPPTPVAFKLQICFFSTVISEAQSSLLLSCDFGVFFRRMHY